MTWLSLRFAGRELRSGVRGFRIFLACLALGVAAIAAASSTAEAFRRGLAAQAREILGGDLSISEQGRRFSPEERAAFTGLGRIADAMVVRAMAEAPAKGDELGERRLVELRGVDGNYPLAGKVELKGAPDLKSAFAGDIPGAAVEQALLDRLKLKLGDRFTVGGKDFVVRAVLAAEPDRLGRGFALGPRILVSLPALERSGLISQDALFGETIRIAMHEPDRADAAADAIRKQFPDESFRIRGRSDAAAGLRRLIDQLEYFLGFIGLASLLAGGLGVAGAVGAYLEGRKPSIAVLKALGAESGLIRNLHLIQIGVLAVLGVAIGLALGAASPFLLGWLAGKTLPVPALFAVYPLPLVKAGAFGLLAAAAFSLTPLARARATPPAALFRKDLSGRPGWSLETVGAVLAGLGLAALAVGSAPTPGLAAGMIAGVAVGFGLLWLIGRGATWLAAKARSMTRGPVRLGLANLGGPGSAARTATPSIGLGVALLSAVVLIQSSLLAQVRDAAPRTAPSLVFTQIPPERAAEFDTAIRRVMGPLRPDIYQAAPFVTGRISKVKGEPVDPKAMPANMRWAFDQDLSFSAVGPEPKDAKLTAGRWWPADYAGPPLVALDKRIAEAAGLKVGDTITLDILGRELEARIAALRTIEIGGFGTSFSVTLNPKAVEGANLRILAIAKASVGEEYEILRNLGVSFPQVNVISVREQLESAASLFDRLTLAVRGAAGVAALAGLLVLAGALAAGARARAKEAATLKVLGAARAQILLAYGVEYGAVGLIAGLAGAGLGVAAAYPVITQVFEARWSLDWAGLLVLVGGAAGLAAIGGLLAALQALSKRPAPVLRDD